GVDTASLPVWLLPRPVRVALGRFRPRGVANLAAEAAFDGERWAKRATVALQPGASFEDSEKFPYRVTSGAGTLRINGGVSDETTPPAPGPTSLAIDLTGSVEGAPIRITGRLDDIEAKPPPGQRRPPMPLGWVEVAGNGVPITPRLVTAIPEAPARGFVESLHATGRIDFRWRAERATPIDPSVQTAMDLRLVECRMQYDRFPYPLHGVTGWVRQRGREWSFTDLRSRGAQGGTLVTGSGSLRPDGDGHRLDLRFRGDAAPLDETLFAALPRNAQQAWAFLRPRGSLDFVADIRRDPGAIEPAVRLSMTPHDRSISIEPAFYEGGRPYRLERLDGAFDWADDRLAMRGARAVHGRTTYSADGEWVAAADGGWTLGLQALRADRMAFNRDFLLAAPPGLRSVIEGLDPEGAFDLFDTRLEVTQATTPAPRITARWRVGVSCQQASLYCGVPIDGVSGVVRLGGQSDGVTAQTAGELDLDSAFWNDLQLTDIRGPLWADANDCLIGSGAADRLKAEPRRLTAKAYGGDLAADCWVRYGGRPRYGLKVDAAGVDVARLSSEWLGRREALQGDLNGMVELQGAGESIYGLTGAGRVEVNDADLYELPLLLSLLKYLRNRAPDNSAFNRLEAEFAINAEEVRFERLNLLGDAVSLYGKGTANLQKDIDLTFASIVGRNELAVPVLKAFVSSASEQLLRLRVGGTMDAPVIRREVLPLVGNMLEQLQAEFSRPPTRPLRGPGVTPRRGATARRGVGTETVR
ncbi:MAG: AsmA-like C-terminal region-containing protein, partial [Planctomycetota bacterium]